MPLNRCFIQQRDVDAKPVFRAFRILDEMEPALANARVKDRLQPDSRVFISKDKLSQSTAVWHSKLIKHGLPELFQNGGLHRTIACEQLMRAFVRIKSLCGKFPDKRVRECGFPGGNSSRDPKCRHVARLLWHQRNIKGRLRFHGRKALDFLFLLLLQAHRFAGGIDEAGGDEDDQVPLEMLIHI